MAVSPLETASVLESSLIASSSLPVANATAALPAASLSPTALDSPTINLPLATEGLAASSRGFDPNNVFGQAYLLGNSDVQRPTVVQAYLVDRDKLALRVETSDIVFGTQVPYEAQPQDEIFVSGLETWVSRDGVQIGYLAGAERKILRTFDEFIGEALDVSWADNPLNYSISSSSDPNFGAGVNPEALFRKTKPIDMGNVTVFDRRFSLSHTLYLDLPQEIVAGQAYTIDFAGDVLDDLTFTFDSFSSVSEAVHVTQVGFRPDDPIKQGYLSTWMGDGGAIAYEPGLQFQLVDTATSTVAYSGTVELDKAADSREVTSNKNFALANVYKMDFSEFTQAGTYRLAVEGIGSSLPFEIGENTWADAFYTTARGFYYQRSGIALEQPYADRDRPRAFHPDDGVQVYQSNATLMDLQLDFDVSLDELFANLTAQATEEVLPNAWGGYYDAGDWDRRIDHLVSSRSFIELAELYPDFYNNTNLNIPESGNALPDVIDEALWGIDFFKRLQKADGGIPGGIESAEHPKTGETSWQESLQVYAFAPDMWSSFLYAATAAQAAHWLMTNGFEAQGQDYLDSALKAMAFGERELAAAGGTSRFTEVGDARNLAALSLFRATDDQAWNQLFLATTSFVSDGAELFEFQAYDQREAAFLYARMDFQGQDQRIKGNAVEAILTEASESLTFSDGNSFNWTQENAFAPAVWDGGLGSTNVQNILRAHWLTDNSIFLEYGILGTQVAMGANPENMTYTTGLGLRNPENPLIINDRVLGEEAVPGITLYGPNNLDALGDFFLVNQTADFTFPNITDWPTLESYLDLYLFVPGSELTLHQSMTPTTYALGYLAARQSVGQDIGGIETVQSFLQGEKVDLNPKDGLNNPIQKLLVDDDAYQTNPNESLIIAAPQGLLNGDSFDPQNPLSIIVEDIPSAGGGIFLDQDGSFRYTPAKGFEGIETMTYRLSNGFEQSKLATVSFGVGTLVGLPQDAPVDATPRSIRNPQTTPTTQEIAPPVAASPDIPPVVEAPSTPDVVSSPEPTPLPVPVPVEVVPPEVVEPPSSNGSPTGDAELSTPAASLLSLTPVIAPPLNTAFGSTAPVSTVEITPPEQTPTAVESTETTVSEVLDEINLAQPLPDALVESEVIALPAIADIAPAEHPAENNDPSTPSSAQSFPSETSALFDNHGPLIEVTPEVVEPAHTTPEVLDFSDLLSNNIPDIYPGDFNVLMPGEFDSSFLEWAMDWVEAELAGLLPPGSSIDIDIDININISLPQPDALEPPKVVAAWQEHQQG